MNAKITLISLSDKDYDNVIALWTRAGLKFRPQGRDSRAALTRQMASKAVWLIGAQCGQALTGVVMPSHDARRGWINRLAVDPAFRRQGIGELLALEAMRQLHARGIDVIAATIERHNAASLSLLSKIGFKVDDEIL
jgi:ribosomal protein S18 acetylase RimI-like enzyme